MAKGIDAGNAFLTGVLAKLPPEDRQKGEEALALLKTLGGGTVVAAVGDGTLAQEELSRRLDEQRVQMQELVDRKAEIDAREAGLTSWHEELTDWHAKAKAKALQTAPPADDKSKQVPPAGGLTDEQFNERMTQERAAFLGYQRDQNRITREHFMKFNEVVDLEPLLRHPQIATLGLTGVYDLLHKDRLTKFDTDAKAKAEEAIRLDERQKVLAGQAQMPYPSPTGPGSGSPLDALTAKAAPLVDEAVAHYNRLVAEHAGARPS